MARFEVQTALARRFPRVTPKDFRLVSKDHAYAFDAGYAYRIPEEYRGRLPAGMDLRGSEEAAGYVGEGRSGDEEKRGRLSAVALATLSGLDEDEEAELMRYAEYLRSRRRRNPS